MRLVVAGYFALAVAAAQAVVSPPQTTEGQVTLIGALVIAIGALSYVVRVQYAENRAKESKIAEMTEKYATLIERMTSLMDRIEEREKK